MALTSAQKIKIRMYLGWPGYATYSTEIESALAVVDQDAALQTEVETVLSRLATVEAQILKQHPLAKASKAEETTLNANAYADLRNAGRRECNALAGLLNCVIRRDIFAAGGLSGGPLPMG